MSDHKDPSHAPDSVSDPAENVEAGQDWTDEGGATEDGPAEGYSL